MSKYARDNINAMQGYTWGEQPQDGKTIKLNTNENPYPASPAVQQALNALSTDALRVYPQPTADPLRDAIAAHHGLQRNNIIITHGGDEALRLALATYVDPGQGFGMATPSYSLYPVLARIQDAHIVEVPLDDDWRLPEGFARALNTAGVRLTCIVNPHAPSGALMETGELGALAEALEGVLLIDEAYADFIDPQLGYDSAQLLAEHDNVLILRTFSKGYSLAGLRLGYLLGAEELIDPILSKTRDSYNIDHISQALGLAAFTDRAYAADTWARVRVDRETMQQNLNQLGLTSPPSHANFLLTEVPEKADVNARLLHEQLKQQGVLVRYFDQPRLSNKLRITIGTAAQNERLLDILTARLT